MSEKKHVSLKFDAKIKPIKKLNDEFTLCKCYIQGIGKNRNYSFMSKESVEKNLPTLNYVPVVGRLIQKEDGSYYMGGHDYIVTSNLELKTLTVPYGVVKENSFNYEMVDEYGVQVEYLTAEIILWTGRYPELKEAIYSDDFYFNQSMELNLDKGQYRPLEEDSNYTELLEWTYSALCLLGKADDKSSVEHTEPCFIESKVIPLEFNFSKTEFEKTMSEMKQELSVYFSQSSQKGENAMQNELIQSILAEFELTLEELDFEVTDTLTEEELRNKCNEFTKDKKKNFEKSQAESAEPDTSFSATYRQKREVLSNLLQGSFEKDENGNLIKETYFWLADFDDKFIYVEKSVWTPENYDCSNGRYSYTFDDANLSAEITSEFEEMISAWLTVEENKVVQEMRSNYEAIVKDFEELKQFKADALKEQREIAEEKVFNEFDEQLGEIEAYNILKENCTGLTIEEIEEKCFCLVGKLTAKFSVKSKKEEVIKVPFEHEPDDEDDGYGGLLKKEYKN